MCACMHVWQTADLSNVKVSQLNDFLTDTIGMMFKLPNYNTVQKFKSSLQILVITTEL